MTPWHSRGSRDQISSESWRLRGCWWSKGGALRSARTRLSVRPLHWPSSSSRSCFEPYVPESAGPGQDRRCIGSDPGPCPGATDCTAAQQRGRAAANEPPFVPYWMPMLGSMVAFGVHPVNFLLDNYRKVRSRAGAARKGAYLTSLCRAPGRPTVEPVRRGLYDPALWTQDDLLHDARRGRLLLQRAPRGRQRRAGLRPDHRAGLWQGRRLRRPLRRPCRAEEVRRDARQGAGGQKGRTRG